MANEDMVAQLLKKIKAPEDEERDFRTTRVKELLTPKTAQSATSQTRRQPPMTQQQQPVGQGNQNQQFGFGAQSSSGGDAPEFIYQTLRSVGFTPEQAELFTAIDLAESGGRRDAHNPKGEDSRGWGQINMDAHADKFAGWDLFDPVQNAKAQYIVSGGGQNIRPWSVTHEDRGAPFKKFLGEASRARMAAGE